MRVLFSSHGTAVVVAALAAQLVLTGCVSRGAYQEVVAERDSEIVESVARLHYLDAPVDLEELGRKLPAGQRSEARGVQAPRLDGQVGALQLR